MMKNRPLNDVITDLVRKYVDQEMTQTVSVKSPSRKVLDQKTGEYRDTNAPENLADRQEAIADDVMSRLRDALIDSGLIVAAR
ncbi:MAG: hypothetical protein JXQ99_27200 [Hyphomicrobiaceae bacterium]